MKRVKSFASISPYVDGSLEHPILRRLEWEHQEMRKQLDHLRKIGAQCLKKDTPEQVGHWLALIRETIMQLKRHQNKEERIWTDILTKYMDPEIGPIGVVRYEHEQAILQWAELEQNLADWMDGKRDRELLESAFRRLERLSKLLKEHMEKEERFGYVPVETMLTKEEKEHIHQQLSQLEKAARAERTSGGGADDGAG